jgi:uncharacterized protein (UPF0548 family)
MMFVRPSDSAAMLRLLEELGGTEPTYDELGATLVGKRPEGFHHHGYDVMLGSGPDVFARAVSGLQGWEAHRIAGVRVFPEGAAIAKGTTVIITLGTPLLALAAPCRIVSIIDGQNRWGFAYGTLPGHPEQGEEAFVVSIAPDETVRFEIEAFSRPSDLLVRMSGPVGRGFQQGGTRNYLSALKRFVTAKGNGS